MQGIVEWLDSLGLGEYASRFAENGVDLATLPDLTEQDLKELGVLLGHRRKLARAIAAMGDAPAPPPRSSSPPEPEGERRHLTVMFCDLVGSTGIAARLDAEEWRDLVGGYLDAASAAVRETPWLVSGFSVYVFSNISIRLPIQFRDGGIRRRRARRPRPLDAGASAFRNAEDR